MAEKSDKIGAPPPLRAPPHPPPPMRAPNPPPTFRPPLRFHDFPFLRLDRPLSPRRFIPAIPRFIPPIPTFYPPALGLPPVTCGMYSSCASLVPFDCYQCVANQNYNLERADLYAGDPSFCATQICGTRY
jgi:hypothetical protein